ncbi:hypothetical protein NGDEOPKE_00061 [Enterococcus phage vB_OCPT_Carl]|uniref:Uncharacterized protein n=1 Tax=Enterococcus phage MDA2 TaxID=2816459 RepID=A0AAE7RFJ9_9CAUD|nr:hypothetical protein [Enterococcus phage vB_EfaM_Ef2.1]QVW28096.1 hypothetical protein [Enterococcus phage MDA2]UQT00017.1 hypothetical protein NGDEOPKE_00061 [Enterococcus phage vB_OCPT_Carl]
MGFFIAKFFIALIVVLLVGVAFSIGYYFVKKNKEKSPSDSYDKDNWLDF